MLNSKRFLTVFCLLKRSKARIPCEGSTIKDYAKSEGFGAKGMVSSVSRGQGF